MFRMIDVPIIDILLYYEGIWKSKGQAPRNINLITKLWWSVSFTTCTIYLSVRMLFGQEYDQSFLGLQLLV